MGSARGTVDFTFKGEEVSLRPDMESIEQIEELLDDSILKIAQDMLDRQSMKLKTMKIIVWAGLQGYYRDKDKVKDCPSLHEVGEFLFELGVANKDLIICVGQFLSNAVTTPDEIKAQTRAAKKKAVS